jgi:polar amino acid transport system substrate-binding protein
MRSLAPVALAAALALVVAGCGGSSSDTTTAANDLGLKTAGELLVGSDIPYAPFEFTDAGSSDAKGFDVDLVNAVAKQMGIPKVVFQKETFDTIFTSTATGRFDMAASSITITDERKKTVAFSDPYFEANQSVMIRTADAAAAGGMTGQTITPQVAATLLKGRTIGVQRGTTGADLAKTVPGASVKQFQKVDDAFNALIAKRVDVVLNDYAISAYATVAKPDLKVVAKVSPALAKVKADGEYAAIYKKWFNEEPPATK